MWVGFFVVRGISGREMGSRGGEGYARLGPWRLTTITMEYLLVRQQMWLREFHVIIHSIYE